MDKIDVVANGRWLDINWPIKEGSVVYDVGGFHGLWTEVTRNKFPAGSYTIFEPVSEFYNLLCNKFKGISNVKVVHAGIGKTARQEKLGIDLDATSAHLYRQFPRYETVNVLDLDTVMGNNHIDVMAINCEGAEYEILPALVESGKINNVDYIQVQFHNFVPDAEAKYNQIVEMLGKTHERVFHWDFVWDVWVKK